MGAWGPGKLMLRDNGMFVFGGDAVDMDDHGAHLFEQIFSGSRTFTKVQLLTFGLCLQHPTGQDVRRWPYQL